MRTHLLTPNPYSRPQRPMKKVVGLVVHWVANPGTTAETNRAFFELRKLGKNGYGSAHYIIDPVEIVQCIPEDEVAYHAGTLDPTDYAKEKFWGTQANYHSIGIELCHKDWEGTFDEHTLVLAKMLCASLCIEYRLEPTQDICRHWDISHKPCPKYFVDHPGAFEAFKKEIQEIT